MDIALDASSEQLIRDQLKTGRYAAPGDVVSAALRALSKLDAQDAALAELRAKVAVGIEAANRGDLSDGEEFFEELEREQQSIPNQGRKTA